jgi:hypothetical protein
VIEGGAITGCKSSFHDDITVEEKGAAAAYKCLVLVDRL